MLRPDQTFRTLRNSLFALVLLGVACTKGDKVPTYVVISNPTVVTQSFPVDEGTNSSNITHAWVFVNDKTYGPWQLPARVPVLEQGDVEIKVVAGIERNGLSTDIKQYPFYETYSTNVTLERGIDVNIEPVYNYFEDHDFWHDTFDSGNLFSVSADSDTIFEVSGPMTFEGNNSGAIFLGPDDVFFEAQTNQDFQVPSTSPTYVELNYAGDQTILVGAYVTFNNVEQRVPLVFINPTVLADGTMPWKKIYIDMSPAWSNPLLQDRELFVSVTKDFSPNGVVYLDNVKVVHREL